MPFTDPDFAVETLLRWDPYERCERSPVERWRRESDLHECSCSRLPLLIGERTSFSGADICAALLDILLRLWRPAFTKTPKPPECSNVRKVVTFGPEPTTCLMLCAARWPVLRVPVCFRTLRSVRSPSALQPPFARTYTSKFFFDMTRCKFFAGSERK